MLSRATHGFGHLQVRGPEDGPPALVVPGFIANDRTTMELRRALAEGGWRVHPWGMGWNLGATEDIIDRLAKRIEEAPRSLSTFPRLGSIALFSENFVLVSRPLAEASIDTRPLAPIVRPFSGA